MPQYGFIVWQQVIASASGEQKGEHNEV